MFVQLVDVFLHRLYSLYAEEHLYEFLVACALQPGGVYTRGRALRSPQKSFSNGWVHHAPLAATQSVIAAQQTARLFSLKCLYRVYVRVGLVTPRHVWCQTRLRFMSRQVQHLGAGGKHPGRTSVRCLRGEVGWTHAAVGLNFKHVRVKQPFFLKCRFGNLNDFKVRENMCKLKQYYPSPII